MHYKLVFFKKVQKF